MIFKQFLFSFFSTVGFSVFFNAPRSSVPYAGFTGGFGWIAYYILKSAGYIAPLASLAGAIVVGMLGELFARIDKKPVTAFIVPGIIPLVPGYGLYLTMISLLNNDYTAAIQIGNETILIGGAIAMGIIIVSSMAKIFKSRKTIILHSVEK